MPINIQKCLISRIYRKFSTLSKFTFSLVPKDSGINLSIKHTRKYRYQLLYHILV